MTRSPELPLLHLGLGPNPRVACAPSVDVPLELLGGDDGPGSNIPGLASSRRSVLLYLEPSSKGPEEGEDLDPPPRRLQGRRPLLAHRAQRCQATFPHPG